MRQRALLVLATIMTITFHAYVVARWDPLQFRHNGAIKLYLLTVLVVAGAALLPLAIPRRVAAVAGVALAALGLAFLAGGLWLVGDLGDDHASVYSRVSGPDSRYELVLMTVAPFPVIDPYAEVRLRAGQGPLAQETVAWRSHEDGPGVKSVRFVGPRTVEVIAEDGCRYRSTFDGLTLRLDHRHSATYGKGC